MSNVLQKALDAAHGVFTKGNVELGLSEEEFTAAMMKVAELRAREGEDLPSAFARLVAEGDPDVVVLSKARDAVLVAKQSERPANKAARAEAVASAERTLERYTKSRAGDGESEVDAMSRLAREDGSFAKLYSALRDARRGT